MVNFKYNSLYFGTTSFPPSLVRRSRDRNSCSITSTFTSTFTFTFTLFYLLTSQATTAFSSSSSSSSSSSPFSYKYPLLSFATSGSLTRPASTSSTPKARPISTFTSTSTSTFPAAVAAAPFTRRPQFSRFHFHHKMSSSYSSSSSAAETAQGTPNPASASASASATTTTTTPPIPPIAKREEDRVVYAGVLPPNNNDNNNNNNNNNNTEKELIRQSESSTNALLDPPRPIKDVYGWMRDESRTDQAVLDHLHAENAYTQQITHHLTSLREQLNTEMVSSLQETDYTTPAPRDGKYYYYTRTNKGQSYKIYCRAPIDTTNSNGANDAVDEVDVDFDVDKVPTVQWDGSPDSPILPNEEIYLNVNDLAEGKTYCSVSSVSISPDDTHKYLAYAVDFSGDEIYSLCVKDLESGSIVDGGHGGDGVDGGETIECYSVTWGKDSKTLFYVVMDDAHRPYRVYRRQLNLDGNAGGEGKGAGKGAGDELIFEQNDDLYWTSIYKSSDKKYLFISTSSAETSEVYYLDLEDEDAELKCVAEKRTKVLYEVEHFNGQWIITSNVDETPNMRLMSCPVGANCEAEWKDVIDVSNESDESGASDESKSSGTKLFDGGYDRSLDGVEAFEKYLVATGREGGIPRVWVIEPSTSGEVLEVKKSTQLVFDESAYDVGVGVNYDYSTEKLTLYYNSLTTPLQSLQVTMNDPNNKDKRVVLKKKNVPGYQKSTYGCQRINVTVRDGTEVPVSMVYRNDDMEEHIANGTTMPVHLVGYGSYGLCSEADFSATRLPLLNRGIIYAIAHVRGGGEMGRQWYEEPNGAKYLCKKNTFNDFCDVAKWLIEDKKLTTPPQLSCEGRSAGGLLIGASINQAPELFGVAILGVPFVDVVCTMTDSSIPLTCAEWEEWGNPNEEKFFEYMKSYSPINNVKQGVKYPSCLLTGGLHDPRVQYWEPAKFAAELRHGHDKDSSGPVCLKIDMTAGHFSASDRYKYLSELAFDYAFLLDQLGLNEKK